MIYCYIGGARSGKSRRALANSNRTTRQKHFIATAELVDDEFAERIKKHQAERDTSWTTHECPLDVVNLLTELDSKQCLIVIDCLTVWLGNLLHHQLEITQETNRLTAFLRSAHSEIHLVTNEVGLSIVPETQMGREFRDLQGHLNQDIAAIADHVELLVAGISVPIKSADS